MARGRMLNKKISENIQFNTMLPDDTCRLMATWIIAHLDKNGVFYAEPILVKSMVLPWRADITVQQVEHYLLAMEQAGLIVIFQAKGQRWQWWPGFIANQVGLRQDRETSDYPDPANFIDDLATADSAGPPDGRNGDGNAPIINEGSGESLPEESRNDAGSLPEEILPNRSLNESELESLSNDNGATAPPTFEPKEQEPETQDGQGDPVVTKSELEPANEREALLFELLKPEFIAKNHKPPKKFPSLACKRKYVARANYLGDNTRPAIERALQKGIASVTGVVDFIAKWNPENENKARNNGHETHYKKPTVDLEAYRHLEAQNQPPVDTG